MSLAGETSPSLYHYQNTPIGKASFVVPAKEASLAQRCKNMRRFVATGDTLIFTRILQCVRRLLPHPVVSVTSLTLTLTLETDKYELHPFFSLVGKRMPVQDVFFLAYLC